METLQQQKTPQKASYGSRSSVSDAAISHPSRTIVHAKLEMTEPGDHDEQEADAAANDIVSGGKIRRKISNGSGSGTAVSPQVESQIAQLQGGGHAMPAGLRNMMENGFGRDFSQVRLHTDSQAADMSSSISARAFTHGNNIYFNRGQFSPNTSEGQRLVAHELTHVAQGTGKVGREEEEEEEKEDVDIRLLQEHLSQTYSYAPNVNFNRYGQYAKRSGHKLIDCDVYAYEIISYLEQLKNSDTTIRDDLNNRLNNINNTNNINREQYLTEVIKNDYYPIVFKNHMSLLFRHNGKWYISDNEYIEEIKFRKGTRDDPNSVVELALPMIEELHGDDLYFVDNNKKEFYYFNKQKKKKKVSFNNGLQLPNRTFDLQ